MRHSLIVRRPYRSSATSATRFEFDACPLFAADSLEFSASRPSDLHGHTIVAT
jgi:hypothetical protein